MKHMLKNLLYLTTWAGLLSIPLSAAHHGWSSYRDDFKLTVTVSELKLRNPHDRIIGIDREGTVWNLLLAPPARNRRFGFDESSIEVDQEISIIGQKHPRKREVKVHCIYAGERLIYTYRYPYGDSSLQRLGYEQDC
jgi:hypothetical protein